MVVSMAILAQHQQENARCKVTQQTAQRRADGHPRASDQRCERGRFYTKVAQYGHYQDDVQSHGDEVHQIALTILMSQCPTTNTAIAPKDLGPKAISMGCT